MSMRISALLLAMVALSSPAVAESYERYTNEDIGFSIALPTDTFAVTSESAGRLSLEEVGGAAQIDVFGVRNPEALTIGEFRALIESADPDRRITYRASGRSWFVLSGFLDGETEPAIFYAKFILNSARNTLSAFEISYPRSEKAAYDGMVERIENSLTRPR